MNNLPRLSGRLTTWKDDRGFGFITPDNGGKEVFVHISAFSNRDRRPNVGERLVYAVKADNKGRTQAWRLLFEDDSARKSSTERSPTAAPVVAAGVFLVGLLGLVLTGQLPFMVWLVYLVASAVAFIAYAWDKSAAQTDRWRTAESTLHLLGLVGGWPGALIARHGLRHKTRKQSFIITFWTTVAINICALAWSLTPTGQAFLGV